MNRARVRIGTSGWHYKHWCGPFYEDRTAPSQMLQVYLRYFDTVEINNSFYKLPSAETFRSWRQSAPPGFCFAVKASRFITHMKKLKDPQNALDNILKRAAELKDKLGPILFQLPPKWMVNAERLEEFLAALPQRHQYTFEFRERSWHQDAIYDILRRHNAAFCMYELNGFHSPEPITADFTYIRLHGPGGPYQGSYSQETLREWARKIERWGERLKDIYVYFDNDQAAFAARNALQLKQMVRADRETRAA
ncbi:MAG: DUF72 domain-containing protein [Terriglobales bacterium]